MNTQTIPEILFTFLKHRVCDDAALGNVLRIIIIIIFFFVDFSTLFAVIKRQNVAFPTLAMKAYRGRGRVATLILTLGSSWR